MTGNVEPRYAKLTVLLPWRVWTALARLAEDDQISKTETVRRAISTEVFRRKVERDGGRLVVHRADGSYEQINWTY